MEMELNESIAPITLKIIDLYNKIDNNLLNTQPDYQRKLVWKKQHKFAFIDTILKNYPFPEIYVASADMDVVQITAKEVVVDGQQRLTTIVDYIKGRGDFMNQKKIPSFASLSPDKKRTFLNYKVSVRDLKDIDQALITEIFLRINSTEYSLNVIEKNNAQFGDGEISVFCKQLIDLNYTPDPEMTDIVLNGDNRQTVFSFFDEHSIFTENDRKRMYDFQYFMLITATILEGSYFGRSVKVDEYLEKYNSDFRPYEVVLERILSAISLFNELNFPNDSYWFNKANVFSLLIEFSKIEKINSIDRLLLELKLNDLENKVDIYFNTENEGELALISEDERKYFEYARHGSHEKPQREHRGQVISQILQACINKETPKNVQEKILELQSEQANFALFIPTRTGLDKSILDATKDIRMVLRESGVHDFFSQEKGPEHKIKKDCILRSESDINSEVSLYRSHGRGDYRMWIQDLKEIANPDEYIAMIVDHGNLIFKNLSK
jgi:hypothetical protein